MIVYQSTKLGFLKDASNGIEDIVRSKVKEKLNIDIQVGSSEYNSWKNSLGDAMYKVMQTDKIPDDSGIAIEYNIPRAKNRIDFIVTGEDSEGKEKIVIIELKQWTDVQKTDKDGVVLTRFKSGPKEEPHPSYQAWSYSALLHGFNATVYEEKIGLEPCAYLHNHVDDGVILSPFYEEYLQKAPAFCKGDKEKLQDFIAKFVKHGEKKNTLYRIDNGEIRPSKNLADSLNSMLKGNNEFILIDEQKIVYETALSLTKKSSSVNKNVLIVEGGPGTGKSVVAINLLVTITKLGLNTQYVTKNAAPRGVFEAKLTGSFKKSEISNFFTGSGSFVEEKENIFDALIIDEAHRLNAKSGMFKNLGENQIKEIIDASKCSIFFIDEDQKVTWHDIGRKDEIEKWANKIGAKITDLKLESQFRCNGSDGYLSWLDNVLEIEETANTTLEGIDYDFKVISSPNELRDIIFDKNKLNNKARLVAGYCWDWVSKKDKNLNDIIFPDYNFGMKWNLASDGNIYIIAPESVNEVGCIHTCQGLEVDYVGVIVGDDFVVRNGEVVTNPSKRAKTDASLKGYVKELKIDPETTKNKAEAIIKNTYRTLMTRGMKGCYVYFVDKETEEYFRDRVGNNISRKKEEVVIKKNIPSPYTGAMVDLPLYESVGCGELMLADPVPVETISVRKDYLSGGSKYFVLRVTGDSMNKAGINDGDLVLCVKNYHPEIGNKVVALIGDDATIKEYHREGDTVVLKPNSTNPKHQPLIFTDNEEMKVLAVVFRVLDRED
jgi:SOS-response transcriptional repressor LexA